MTFLTRPTSGSEPLLELDGLTVEFTTEDGVLRAVRGVSLTLERGEVLGIVGESGSGKSVTCLALMGLLPKTAKVRGSARFQGTELVGMSQGEINRLRGDSIAMIFQDPMTSLNPVHKIGAQIAEAVRAHNDVGQKEAMEQAVAMLDVVGIPQAATRASNYPHEFSGGMRQRAMIAMAMANDPDVIIADEPTTALDVTVQAQVLETLKKAKAETNSALILITHDLGVVANMADRVLVMYAGRPVEYGTVDDIYDRPRMPYTTGLLGSLPRVDTDGSERLTPIQGAPPSLLNLLPGCPFQPRCPMSRDRCLEEEPALQVTDNAEHYAACHFWNDLVGELDVEDLFKPVSDDPDLVAPDVLEES